MSQRFIHKGIILEPADFKGFDWIPAMRELGLNTLGLHSGPGVAAENIPEKLGHTLSGEFREKAHANGLQLEFELHTGGALLPRSFFETNPEYFVYDMGRKTRISEFNWCPTHPEANRIIRENAVSLAKVLSPDTHRYFFWGDDACMWCRCPNCHCFNDSELALLTANQIAEAVSVYDPEARVAFLAYLNTLDAPRLVKPHEHVFLEFAPIRRCWEHAINDPSCAVNRTQWQALLKQMELFPEERVHVLEYWLDSSLASHWKRPAQKVYFQKKIAEADIAAYHELGIRSITTFAVYMDGDYFKHHGDRELREYAELLNHYD